MASIYTVVIALIVLFGLYAAFNASMCLAKSFICAKYCCRRDLREIALYDYGIALIAFFSSSSFSDSISSFTIIQT